MYLTAKALGWLNSYQGLIVPLSVSAFGVFIMREHLLSIPDDLMHSGRAIAVIAAVPIVLAYAAFQRYFIEGIAMTGFK